MCNTPFYVKAYRIEDYKLSMLDFNHNILGTNITHFQINHEKKTTIAKSTEF